MFLNLSESDQHDWRPFKAGYDVDGAILYICRVFYSDRIIPGKYSKTIRKCSISFEGKEKQFDRFQVLIEDQQLNYRWFQLKNPVLKLPETILYGGKTNQKLRLNKLNEKKKDLFDQIFFNKTITKKHFNNRRHRNRRDIARTIDEWADNWRGFEADRTKKVSIRMIDLSSNKIHNKKKDNEENSIDNQNDLSSAWSTDIERNPIECHQEFSTANNNIVSSGAKSNYYIAKCLLRTGYTFSEQIGKIWWNHRTWTASFSFGGYEINCIDFYALIVD